MQWVFRKVDSEGRVLRSSVRLDPRRLKVLSFNDAGRFYTCLMEENGHVTRVDILNSSRMKKLIDRDYIKVLKHGNIYLRKDSVVRLNTGAFCLESITTDSSLFPEILTCGIDTEEE